MPDTFTVVGKIACPNCGVVVLNSARFQWGEVPGQAYDIGDQIRWLRGGDGEIVTPFRLRLVGPNRWRWNCGDPAVDQAFLLDEDVYTGNHSLSCERCNLDILAISCNIQGNHIFSVAAISRAELIQLFGQSVGKANIATFDDNGLVPREDWYDHPIEGLR